MEIFVLIYAIVGSYGSGSGSAEFIGRDACEQAGTAVVEEMDGLTRNVLFVCVPKHGGR